MRTLDSTLGIQRYPVRRVKRPSARRKHPYPFTFRETPLFTPQDLLDEDEDLLSPAPSFHRSRSPSLDHRPLPDSARTSVLEQDPFYFAPSSPAKSPASSQASLRRSINGRKSGVQRPTRRSCVQRRRGEHRARGATFRASAGGSRPVFNQVNWACAGDGARAQPTVTNDLSPTQPARSLKTTLSFILNAPDDKALWRRPWGSDDGFVPETKFGIAQDHPSAVRETRPPSPPVSVSSHPSECDDVVPPILDARSDAPIRVDQCCFPKIPLPPLLIDLSVDDEGDLEDDGPLQLQYPDSASPHAESPEELNVPIARKWQADLKTDHLSDNGMECEAEKDGAGSAMPTTGWSLTVAQAATSDRAFQSSETTCDDLNDPFAATKKPPQSNDSPTDPTDPFINATSTDYERPKPDFALHPLVESDPAVLGPAILVFNDLVDAPKGPGKKPRIPRDTKFALKVNARAKQGEMVKDVAKVKEDAAKVKEDAAKVNEDAANVNGTKAEARRPYYREEAEKEEAKKPCVVGPRIPDPVHRVRKTKATAPPQAVTASALSSGDVKKGDSSEFAASSASLPQPSSTPSSGPLFSATSEPFPATLDPEIRSRRGRPLRPQQREARARRDAMEQQKKAVLLAFRDAAAKARRRVGIFRAMVRAMEDTMGMEDVKWGRVGKVREVVGSRVAEACLSVIDGGISNPPVLAVTTSSEQQSSPTDSRVERGSLHYQHGAKSSEDRLLALAESALSASCQQEATSFVKTSSRASIESESESSSSGLGARPRRISLQAYLKRKRESASDSEGDNKRCRRG